MIKAVILIAMLVLAALIVAFIVRAITTGGDA